MHTTPTRADAMPGIITVDLDADGSRGFLSMETLDLVQPAMAGKPLPAIMRRAHIIVNNLNPIVAKPNLAWVHRASTRTSLRRLGRRSWISRTPEQRHPLSSTVRMLHGSSSGSSVLGRVVRRRRFPRGAFAGGPNVQT